MMRSGKAASWTILTVFTLFAATVRAQEARKDAAKDTAKESAKDLEPTIPKDSTTQGSVTVAGHVINYQAVAGTILVGATNDADAAVGFHPAAMKETDDAAPTARMFYVA